MSDVLLVARAADFAARRHSGQRRKGAAAEPYVEHLAEVAALLAEATRGADAVLVAAGFLHDTLEDTATERDELEAEFGPEVAALVAEVTDDKSLAKAERKRRQIETAASKSRRAKLLKLADKTSNLRALAASPPAGWDRTRLLDYVDWAEEVVARCRGVDAWLERRFDAAAAEARAAIAATAA
jgi:(p)ppGpp synthase/HD superfamily hydrolase